MKITRAASFTTSDGESFSTRDEAVAHEKSVRRFEQLDDLGLFDSGTIGTLVNNADAVVAALTVKQERKRKAAQQDAVAA